ncbi:hypothetical protein BJX99DRAFT_263299 [Aspergillus californicus]
MTEPAHFLCLPYEVRLQIYRYVSLVYSGSIYMSASGWPLSGQWSSREKRVFRQNESEFGFCFPNQLFYVSRAISEDARRVFYSENILHFSDKSYKGWDLRILFHLSPLAWKSLRRIGVKIGCAPCQSPINPGDTNCHGEVSEILTNDGQLEASGVITTWKWICSQWAKYQTDDDRLEMRLICGAASKYTAAQFLDPLHDLPRFKDLKIRLGSNRDVDLQHMVMKTMRQKTRCFPPEREGTFPFLKLPVELQIRVLEYSGLVAPKPLISRAIYTHFTPSDCWHFVCTAQPKRGDSWGDNYCPSTHTAFSSSYPCWVITNGLFLASKRIRQIALRIYHLKNTFQIWYEPAEKTKIASITWSPRTHGFFGLPTDHTWSPQTSGFLARLPEHSWQHLRHIHWVFPRMDEHAFLPDNQETEDWINTLRSISLAVPPCALILEMTFQDSGFHAYGIQWALYNRIVDPIITHRGMLKDFIVHTSRPLDGSLEETRRGQEYSLERRVMGDDYDMQAFNGVQSLSCIIPELIIDLSFSITIFAISHLTLPEHIPEIAIRYAFYLDYTVLLALLLGVLLQTTARAVPSQDNETLLPRVEIIPPKVPHQPIDGTTPRTGDTQAPPPIIVNPKLHPKPISEPKPGNTHCRREDSSKCISLHDPVGYTWEDMERTRDGKAAFGQMNWNPPHMETDEQRLTFKKSLMNLAFRVYSGFLHNGKVISGNGFHLVAALHVPGEGVFLSTIPRGIRASQILSDWHRKSPKLWGATGHERDTDKDILHAEDAAVYQYESSKPLQTDDDLEGNPFLPRGSQIVIFGKRTAADKNAEVQPPCQGNNDRSPGCTEVMKDLGIQVITKEQAPNKNP